MYYSYASSWLLMLFYVKVDIEKKRASRRAREQKKKEEDDKRERQKQQELSKAADEPVEAWV